MTAEFSGVRDQLALQRTMLANERTFLAYVRTGLSLFAAAAVLFQFFSSRSSYIAVGWMLAVAGLLVLVVGVVRFFRVQASLKSAK